MSGRGVGSGAAESALPVGDGPGAGCPPAQARAASTESNGGMRRRKEPPVGNERPRHYALRWGGEGMDEDGGVAGVALAGGGPGPAGGGECSRVRSARGGGSGT